MRGRTKSAGKPFRTIYYFRKLLLSSAVARGFVPADVTAGPAIAKLPIGAL
jgi:hypothetical protein